MRFSCAATLLALSPCAASAAEVWKDLGEWQVLVDTRDASKCYASRTVDDGTEIQIGAEPTLDGGFFAVYNAAWTHVEDGLQSEIEFDFGTSRFGGEVFGKIENGVPGGYAFFNNPAFVQDFARKQTVTVKGKSGTEFTLDLTGTSRAIRAVLACQDDQPEPVPSK